MKVLLVQPPIIHNAASVTPPLGLAYIGAVLEEKGVEVHCLLADVEHLSIDQIVERVCSVDPDIIGISTTTPSVNISIHLITRIKALLPKIVAIAGGAHATLFPGELLQSGFDYIVCGEGEETITDLMKVIDGKLDASHVAGLAYRNQNEIQVNKPRPFIKDLDVLPFPAWHLFPIHLYKSDFKKNDYCLPIITSRGCPGKCVFCYKGLFGNKFRFRSPENIVEELRYLIKTFHIAEYAILDDNFSTIPRRVFRFCELLHENNVTLPWSLSSGIRVDTASAEMFRALKAAGCYRIGFGVESGNEEILKIIQKNISKDQVRKAVRLAKEAGMEVYCFFMIGNLQETHSTIDDTIQFARELSPDVAQFSVATPFPGSEMYDTLLKEGRITAGSWDDFDYLSGRNNCFRHENLSQEEIAQRLKQAYRSFYLHPGYFLRRIKSIHSLSDLFKNIRGMSRLFKFTS